MRNWIQTVKIGTPGPEIEPFVPTRNLRRPIDMKIGSYGALYMIEYGDQWWENNDSRSVRVVYRRGNRAPVAKIAANETAGKRPLVTFRAGCFDIKGGNLELRSGSPTAPVLASVAVKPSGQADSGEFLSLRAKLTNASGLTDVCIVARGADKNTELGLNWIEFQPRCDL